ncbi:serine/threonine protein kinase [Helicocarpus griseus UAMH5409]|uniref:non-specific serine/threonine protein kinase n=1 Tax=Helicocarpus griseus UAMH5409 TaxID=1447875 RepID=A0A2B7WZU4_9EURO|nr:serine/threonine protein kinase [Helicocarpus griseus UAMH5409]
MDFVYTDKLEKHTWVGGGACAYVYHVWPSIVVKTLRPGLRRNEKDEHPLLKDIAFYKSLNERARGGSISGKLIRVRHYEDPALIARWAQQLTSALEHLEKMGLCHNDLNTTNLLLDESFNLKLTDFGRANRIGQPLEWISAPWALRLNAGPLKGTFGLCCARTEQFAVGSLLYFMAYGHEPYDDIHLEPRELDREFQAMNFPQLNRHKVFDGLISACWHNVYPTMALVAFDFKRKTKDFASATEYKTIDRAKERKVCESLIRKGIMGPELALRFQPFWRRYLGKSMFIWHFLAGMSGKIRLWLWS